MGFGFLLIGYLTMVEVGIRTSELGNIGFEVFPDVIGYVFFLLALRKLKPYSNGFKIAHALSFVLIPLGAVKFIAQFISLLDKYTSLSLGEKGMTVLINLLSGCELSKVILLTVFNIFLFAGIKKLSSEVDLPKIVTRSVIALIINLLYFSLRISAYVFPLSESQAAFIYYSYNILWYALILFTVFLIFGCYMYICYEGEEEIVVPESKLSKLFNKRNE